MEKIITTLITLIGGFILSTSAFSQGLGPNVLSCPTAADGTQFGNVWAPCTPNAASFVAPLTSTIVAAQCPPAWSNTWSLASKVAAGCSVYASQPNPTSPSTNWWPASSITFGGGVGNPPIASLTLSWVAPTQNTDGTPLVTPIASYDIFQGTSANSLTQTANVPAPALSYVTPLLPAGTYFFAVDAKEQNGAVSAQTQPPVSGTVAAAPKCPPQPSNASQVMQCPTGTTGTWTQTHSWTSAAYPTCWTPTPWTPTAPPAGACSGPPAPPTKITVTCTVPTAPGSVACTGIAQ